MAGFDHHTCHQYTQITLKYNFSVKASGNEIVAATTLLLTMLYSTEFSVL